MRRLLIILFALCIPAALTAQWQMRPSGNWWTKWPAYDSVYLFAPVGSKAINCSFALYHFTGPFDTTSDRITVRQDSLFGNRFLPEVVNPFSIVLSRYNSSYNHNFSYMPRYEDTSVIQIGASDSHGQNQKFNVIAITYISASNEYALSRSDFGVHIPGDTGEAWLRFFNQTPDSQRVSVSLSSGADFTIIDTSSSPLILAPGDSAPAVRIIYRANGSKPISRDSLLISVQRIRMDADYGSPLFFRNPVAGHCTSSYATLDRTDFGFIPSGDSTIGYARIVNLSADTGFVRIAVNPSFVFSLSVSQDSILIILPNDSSSSIQLVMHGTPRRKVIRDTVTIRIDFASDTTQRLLQSALLTGGCSTFRFRPDNHHVSLIATIGDSIASGVIIGVACNCEDAFYIEDNTYKTTNEIGVFNQDTLCLDYWERTCRFFAVDGIWVKATHPGHYRCTKVISDCYDNLHCDRDTIIYDVDAVPSSSGVSLPETPQALFVYPTPANSTVQFQICNALAWRSNIRLFNLLGTEIRTVVVAPPGSDCITLDVASVPSGLYLYRFEQGEYRKTGTLSVFH